MTKQTCAAANRAIRAAGITHGVLAFRGGVCAVPTADPTEQAAKFAAALAALDNAGIRYELDPDFPHQAMLEHP